MCCPVLAFRISLDRAYAVPGTDGSYCLLCPVLDVLPACKPARPYPMMSCRLVLASRFALLRSRFALPDRPGFGIAWLYIGGRARG
eukprot:2879817-Rhodomonas_salina.9